MITNIKTTGCCFAKRRNGLGKLKSLSICKQHKKLEKTLV